MISRRGGRSSNSSTRRRRGENSDDESHNNASASRPPGINEPNMDPHLSDIEIDDHEVEEDDDVSSQTVPPLVVPILPSQGIEPPTKIRITAANPAHAGMFMPPEASGSVSDIVKHRFTGPWVRWDDIPDVVRKMMWSDFCKLYEWDDSLAINVEKTFRKKVKNRMTDWFNKARTNKKNPGWMDGDIWETMLKKWDEDPLFKKFSARGKTNRASDAGGLGKALHTQGRRSLAVLRQSMTSSDGKPPTRSELYKKAHTKKGTNEYINERAKNTAIAFDEAMKERERTALEEAVASNTSPIPIDPDIVWLETVGERHGRVYGMGCEAIVAKRKKAYSTTQVPSNSSVGQQPHISSEEMHDLRYRVNELSTQFNAISSQMKTNIMEVFVDVQSKLVESIVEKMNMGMTSRKSKKKKKNKRKVYEPPESSNDEEE